MKNQLYTGTSTSRRFVTLPTTVKAGDAILVGTEPAVALDDYQSNVGGATCLFNGSFLLTVNAWTGTSPLTGQAINPGDKLYASGTLDSATNVTTGLTISKHSTDTFFGRLDPTGPSVTSGSTTTGSVIIGAE